MTNNEASFLSLEEMKALLSDNLKIEIENRIERSFNKTCQGKPLSVIILKLYPQYYYWYSCTNTCYAKS